MIFWRYYVFILGIPFVGYYAHLPPQFALEIKYASIDYYASTVLLYCKELLDIESIYDPNDVLQRTKDGFDQFH